MSLSLGRGCLSHGTITHEIMHGLGIYHQHSRSDRENYVEILWQNINKEDWYNFNMYDNRTVNSHGVPYDFMSTMQYSEYDLSNNTKMTIRTLDENAQRVTSWTESKGFWRGSRLPRLTDIELLRKMYKCEELDLSKVKKLPEDGMPTGAWVLLGVQELKCKYFKGNAAIPQSHVWIKYFERFRKKVWKNCQKLCFNNPECVEWTINTRDWACNVGKSLLKKVL